MNMTDAELAAARTLARALGGAVLVADVTVEPDAPARTRAGRCGCCGLRRDLVACTSANVTAPDICFRCGSDRAQGERECTSKPRTYTQTFTDADWVA